MKVESPSVQSYHTLSNSYLLRSIICPHGSQVCRTVMFRTAYRHTGIDPAAGKDWRQKGKRATEDEVVGWHHWLNGHELGQTPGDSEGQGSLACCSPWVCKELDRTEWLNNNWNRRVGGQIQLLKEWHSLRTQHKQNQMGSRWQTTQLQLDLDPQNVSHSVM